MSQSEQAIRTTRSDLTHLQVRTNAAWYDALSDANVRRELAGACEAYELALPYRFRSLQAKMVVESNDRAIPMLQAILAARSA